MKTTGLKYLYNKYVAEEDEGVNKFESLFNGIPFCYIPLDISTIYGGKDAWMTLKLYQYQNKKLLEPGTEKLRSVFMDIEMPLIPILVDMNRYGVNINTVMIKELYEKYNEKLQEAEKIVYQEIDKYKDKIDEYKLKHFNHKLSDPILISSPAQLSTLFYEILGYKTASGKGTGVDELEEIGTPLTKALLSYRKMSKLIDAFLIALPKQIEPTTGKIHTNLNQYGAETGRFSSSNPKVSWGLYQ